MCPPWCFWGSRGFLGRRWHNCGWSSSDLCSSSTEPQRLIHCLFTDQSWWFTFWVGYRLCKDRFPLDRNMLAITFYSRSLYLASFLSTPSSLRSSQGTVRSIRASCSGASDRMTMSSCNDAAVICAGNLSCLPRFTIICRSLAVERTCSSSRLWF